MVPSTRLASRLFAKVIRRLSSANIHYLLRSYATSCRYQKVQTAWCNTVLRITQLRFHQTGFLLLRMGVLSISDLSLLARHVHIPLSRSIMVSAFINFVVCPYYLRNNYTNFTVLSHITRSSGVLSKICFNVLLCHVFRFSSPQASISVMQLSL
ncbi:hypothetical protein CC86DRAFT_186633 [Ophiobolus disseminans]|uniref:Uncharacterized protein n=1 Tax=Ophiobolus disseminans TaxID=1469910 RepID=A0A6A7A914_9PLEO|nr:hypothetical protein CC86DRAFT_186633 [Ophiobolus disseminans]